MVAHECDRDREDLASPFPPEPVDLVEGSRAEPLDRWTSPTTGATYPARWRIRTAVPALDLEVTPLLPDQELNARASTGSVYWEGAVQVSGSRNGRGYDELTGYGPRVG